MDSLLIGLQLHNRNQEIPSVMDNPLTNVDLEKPAVMTEFKKELNKEAVGVR